MSRLQSPQPPTVFELGAVDDMAEHQADALAARALAGAGGGGGEVGDMAAAPHILRRKTPCGCGGEGCTECGAAADLRSWGQAKQVGTPDRSAVTAALAGPGSMLDPTIRARLESGFGRDFGDVRVHDGSAAWRASAALGARAWTLGSDVAFAEGAYRPGTAEGDQLIAHELAHVVQSNGAGTVLRRQTEPAGCRPDAPDNLSRSRGQQVNPPRNVGVGYPVAYVIWETFRANEDAATWRDRAIRLWVGWRFGRQSPAQQGAVEAFLLREITRVRATSPHVGCHYPLMLAASTYATCMRLSGESAHPREAARPPQAPEATPAAPGVAAGEVSAAAPSAEPSPPPSAAAPVPASARFSSEIAAPPDAPPGGYALPQLPADISGLEIQPIGGTGTYVMNVHWANAGPDLLSQVAEAHLGATYQWEVWDVTGAPLVAEAERNVRRRMRLAHTPDARGRIARRGDGAARDLARAEEDLARRPGQIDADQRATWAEGRYADALADELNRELLPLEELTRYGRELLGGAADLAGNDRDRRIDWPGAGVFVVRCIARARREAGSARAPSVATKLVTTRSAEAASRAALDLPAQQAREARDMAYVLASMEGDPAEIARLRTTAERAERQATGTPLQIVEGELADARAELAEARRIYAAHLAAGLHPERVSSLTTRVDQLEQRRTLLARRSGELAAGGGTVFRVRAALVSAVTGETYQLLLQLAGWQVGTEWTCVLSDVTTADGRRYQGQAPIGADLAAAQNTALDRALAALTDRSEYGDARLSIEVPGDGWLASISRGYRRRTLTVRGSPGGWMGARARLSEVATAMALLGLAIGSGGVAVAGGLIAAGLAADNIARRWREGTLRPDSQLVGDLLDVLGAVAMGMRAIGALSVFNRSGGGVVLRTARAAGTALGVVGHAIDTASDVGGVIIANAEMMGSLLSTAAAERNGDMAPSEARRARLSAIASGLQSNALIIAGHLGARRMLGGASDAGPAATRRGPVDAPSPRESAAPTVPTRTMAGSVGRGGSGSTPPPRPGPANLAAHTAWIDATLAGGMGVRPPPLPHPNRAPLRPGEPRYHLRTMAEALQVYDEFRSRAPGREIGIYQHAETGEYAVVAGREGSVSAPLEGRRPGQRWADAGEWANVLHNHPNPDNVLTYRNPAPADVQGTWREAVAAGRPVAAFIEHDLPGGGRRYTMLRVHPDGRVVVAFAGEDGRPSVRGYPDLAAYAADWGGRTRYAEPGSSGYADMMADVEGWQRDRTQSGALPPSGDRTMAGTGAVPPAAPPVPASATPVTPAAGPAAPLAHPATAAPAPVIPRIVDPAGRLGGFTISDFDRRTAGTGGITDISFQPDPAGRFAVRIIGMLRRGLWRRGGTPPPGRPRAPNYNRSSSLVTHAEAGLPTGQWENLHLVGPGFGDEAAAGMMKGPREVNQWHQNRGVEGWMRDLFRAVDPLGGRVRYEATAVAWDLDDGGWQPAMQTDFLRRAQYRVTVELPDRPARTITINIEVERPPSTRAHVSVEPSSALNPAHFLGE